MSEAAGIEKFVLMFEEMLLQHLKSGNDVTLGAIPKWMPEFEAYFVITKPGINAEDIAVAFKKSEDKLDAKETRRPKGWWRNRKL